MENKKFKFISAYAIYIGVITFIIFFGKDFLNLTFLIFENLWNFFSAIEGVYYGIGIVLFCSLAFVWALLINLENKIVGILIFLLIITPLLFLFFYYSNANFSLNYFRKLYDLQFPIILILFIVVFSCFVTLTIDEKRL
ncbi:hypothetical protein N3S94_001092 [Campylobacter jejuni]|uniref:Uncharacterized protein n=1 Tax=Campylobacter jejuni TaxID=197 RepID=A0A5Y9FNG4_CAMJU|nr:MULTISPECIES: hypothetical protein [Campylobacter]AHK74275.1 hypothetical protein YSQ_10115 [Campylobacter coli RM1875]EAH6789988.1 hypothetical protein [Campylobacter jejuni]EAH7868865.1 hypothetical protein [Campylobacter jejuni]EAH8066345.1 hypothetical protein [Campylobacter jejuni]EAH8276280.1 hypothetical protein [Campylobacter jejuni]